MTRPARARSPHAPPARPIAAVLAALAAATLTAAPSSSRAEEGGGAEAEAASDPGRTTEPRWGERFRPYSLRAVGEVGFLAVLDHRVQFSEDGTYIDYVREGGQETLFFVGRLSVELTLYRQHRIVLLYQPLSLATDALAERDLVVDEETFPEGTPMRFLYDFPFYRLSYMYDVFPDPRLELSVGVSLQIRNATITFSSADGTLYRENRDVGPVPLLKLRLMYYFDNGLFLGTEIDGIYAPVSYLNGSDTEVVGALLDASLRAGLLLPRNVEVFLNARYLGGGAVGTSDDVEGPGDGYVRNWLHFMTVTLGVNWDVI